MGSSSPSSAAFGENRIDALQFFRRRFGVGFEKNGSEKFPELQPEIRILCRHLHGAVERGESFLRLTHREIDFVNSLVGFDVLRIERDSLFRIFQSLLHLLQVLRIQDSKLQVGRRFFWIRLDRVFQNIDRKGDILLLHQQRGHVRREVDLARIDGEHFLVGIDRFLHLAQFLPAFAFHELRQRIGFARGAWLQGQIIRRSENDRIVLAFCRRGSGARFVQRLFHGRSRECALRRQEHGGA